MKNWAKKIYGNDFDAGAAVSRNLTRIKADK